MAAKKKGRRRKPIQAYAFIDTNIFLDFYRSRSEATLSMLRKLDGVKDRVICTYQVEMEFLKNRQKEILRIAQDSQLSIDPRLPAVMGNSKLDATLKREKAHLDRQKKQLEKRVAKLLDNPRSHDPIFRTLENVFNSESDHVLTRDMPIRHKIKRLAWRRFVLGYPPRKDRDTATGDALNWEWLIHCAQELRGRFIIVSRDSDYGSEYKGQYFLNDALKDEFRDRVGRKSIVFSRKLSDALKLLEVPVTKAEEQSEQEELAQGSDSPQSLADSAMSAYQAYWQEVAQKLTGETPPNLDRLMRSAVTALKVHRALQEAKKKGE